MRWQVNYYSAQTTCHAFISGSPFNEQDSGHVSFCHCLQADGENLLLPDAALELFTLKILKATRVLAGPRFPCAKCLTTSIQQEAQCGRINGHQASEHSVGDSSTYRGVFLSPSLATKGDSETRQLIFGSSCVSAMTFRRAKLRKKEMVGNC